MKMKIEVEVEPFTAPNFVRVSDAAETAVPLADVDAQVLSALCDQFRESVFKIARKKDPRL